MTCEFYVKIFSTYFLVFNPNMFMNELLNCCMDSWYLKSTCVYYIFNTGVTGMYFYINRSQRKTVTKRQDWKKKKNFMEPTTSCGDPLSLSLTRLANHHLA